MQINPQIHNNIFLPEQVNFLFNLYDSMYIYDPIEKKKIRFKNGLIQGSALSPYLFNIYFERLLVIFQSKIDKIKGNLDNRQTKKKRLLGDIQILAYADDLAIISDQDIIALVCETFIEATREIGLLVNLKKSKYIANRHNVPLDHKRLEKLGLTQEGEQKSNLGFQDKSQFGNPNNFAKLEEFYTLGSLLSYGFYMFCHLLDIITWPFGFRRNLRQNYGKLLKRNSFRRVMGLANNFPKQQIDELIGLLEFDISKDKYIDRQIRWDIFREYIAKEMDVGNVDASKLKNCSQYYMFRAGILKEEGNEQRNEEVMILGYSDLTTFWAYQPEYGQTLESYEAAMENKFERKRKELDAAEKERLIRKGYEEQTN